MVVQPFDRLSFVTCFGNLHAITNTLFYEVFLFPDYNTETQHRESSDERGGINRLRLHNANPGLHLQQDLYAQSTN